MTPTKKQEKFVSQTERFNRIPVLRYMRLSVEVALKQIAKQKQGYEVEFSIRSIQEVENHTATQNVAEKEPHMIPV